MSPFGAILAAVRAKGGGSLWKQETHTLTLQPGSVGIDANARRYSADTNYGISTNLYARASDGANDSNILLKFDLSGIPAGAIITGVNFYMSGYATQGATATLSLYRILAANSGWTEAGATWNYAVASSVRWAGDVGNNGGADAGCSVSGIDHSVTPMGSFIVTVGDAGGTHYSAALSLSEFNLMLAANYGIIIKSSVADHWAYLCSSNHATLTDHPKLFITYTITVPYADVLSAYAQKIKSLFGADLWRYFQLNEADGSEIIDKSAHVDNGAYSTDTPPLLAQTGFDTRTGANFRANSFGNIYTAAFAAGVNLAEFSLGFAFKPADVPYWTDGTTRQFLSFRVDANNYITVSKHPTAGTINFYYVAGGVTSLIGYIPYAFCSVYNGWLQYILTVSKSNNRMRIYVCGQQREVAATGLGTWAGSLLSDVCVIGNWKTDYILQAALGTMQDVWYVNREITAAEAKIAGGFAANTDKNILFLGDSKTFATTGDKSYRTDLETYLAAINNVYVNEIPSTIAVSGIMTFLHGSGGDGMYVRCDADIAAMTGTPDIILYNLGANDVSSDAGVAVEWATDTCYILDAYHTKFPNAKIYMAKVWRRNIDGLIAPRITIINGYIDASVLPGRTAWLSVGINEANILPLADDGATMTVDGTHYSAVGAAAIAAAWKTAIGY